MNDSCEILRDAAHNTKDLWSPPWDVTFKDHGSWMMSIMTVVSFLKLISERTENSQPLEIKRKTSCNLQIESTGMSGQSLLGFQERLVLSQPHANSQSSHVRQSKCCRWPSLVCSHPFVTGCRHPVLVPFHSPTENQKWVPDVFVKIVFSDLYPFAKAAEMCCYLSVAARLPDTLINPLTGSNDWWLW